MLASHSLYFCVHLPSAGIIGMQEITFESRPKEMNKVKLGANKGLLGKAVHAKALW